LENLLGKEIIVGLYIKIKNITLFSILAAAITATSLSASAQELSAQDTYTAARKHFGLLTYCQKAGHIDAATAQASKESITKLIKTVPKNKKTGDTAEEEGEMGRVYYETSAEAGMDPIEDVAKQTGTTIPQLCKKISQATTVTLERYK
jgi:hypothetical protein